MSILCCVAVIPGLKEHQLSGNGNAGCQYHVQSGFIVMGESDADFRPPGVFFTLWVGLTFLGDKYVINGFSHDASSNKNNNELNECHIPILHSGFNGSARTFSGTLNCGFVTARNLFLKSSTRPGEINVHSGIYYVMRFSGSDIRGGI
ncbi:hypothetical protein BN1007_70120 [Klebsiella variicola]|nr:hypothetical protein BN1007_70120 [Klebsiella variicola]